MLIEFTVKPMYEEKLHGLFLLRCLEESQVLLRVKEAQCIIIIKKLTSMVEMV